MTALWPDGDAFLAHDGERYKFCRNATEWGACNWLIPAQSTDNYCISCELNAKIPDLSQSENLAYWRKLEQGKRRLVYGILRLGLPLVSHRKDKASGLSFEFLRLQAIVDGEEDEVRTGHLNGKITVDVIEADDLERERTRLHLNETYRSVLGHFRHESGHYYWWKLVSKGRRLNEYRELFGDETRDYESALNDYYQKGPVAHWQDSFVSAYASSHPWEDWAECWTHYLTIIDALETAEAFGVVLSPDHSHNLFLPSDSYRAHTFDDLLDRWLPLTYAVNSINRSAGQRDLYPFVLPGPAIEKLRLIHQVISENRVSQGF
jgi:hypothetical protein